MITRLDDQDSRNVTCSTSFIVQTCQPSRFWRDSPAFLPDVPRPSNVERGSSVVECRTRNQVSPGSNPPLLPFGRLGIFLRLSCLNDYLAIDSGGNVSDVVVARNCCMTCFPEKRRTVSK